MKDDICKVCGLSKELCICEEIKKDYTKISVVYEPRKYNKFMTILTVDGDVDIENLVRTLKKRLACGGTYKSNKILLQGKHKNVKEVLKEMGFKCL